MAEADLHLKLDRILAQQERLLARQDVFETTIGTLIRGLTAHGDALDTLREALERLWTAVTEEDEGGGEMRDLIVTMNRLLAQIVADGERMVTVINTLPRAMSDAAMDGVRLAMGDGVSVPRP